ncbi:MAG: ArsR/SmtB family transcription factor [Lachnospiraceae bacterium]|jgi:DNA-binding transcriptional ArsR family regulator
MVFSKQLQYIWEAVAVLNNAASGYLDLTEKAENLPEDCRADLARLSEIQTEAVQGLSEAQIIRYFKPLTTGRDCIADYLCCLHTAAFGETLEEIAARYDLLTLDDRLFEANTDGGEVKDLAEFTDYLGTLELDDSTRWQILTALLHPKVHKEGIFDLLRYVMEKLHRHEAELETIFVRRRAELVAWDRENPIRNLMQEQSTYVLQNDVLPHDITVLIFEPRIFRGHIWDAGSKSWFSVGAFLPHFLAVQPCKNLEKQDIVNYGKVFSDGSKLEILRLLSQRCYINRELAAALGLSTATISHHMSVLTEMGLVQTTISANRILYNLNREKLSEISTGIAAYFSALART